MAKQEITLTGLDGHEDHLVYDAANGDRIANPTEQGNSLEECARSLFPQEGETTPRLRFQGFEGEWEKAKLSNYAIRITRKNSMLETTLPLTISSIEGLIEQTQFFNNIVASDNMAGYYLLKKGEFAYNKSYSNGYPYGSVKRLDKYEMGALSPLYIVFSINDNIYSDYLVTFFETSLWHSEVAKRAAEGARNHGLLNISAEDFLDIEIKYPPSLEEQKAIASFFRRLDAQIAIQQQRLERLKQMKSACLRSMFPQNGGGNLPLIRFKGFNGEWILIKFKDMAELRRGLTYSPSHIVSDGVRVLRSCNINEDSFVVSEDDVFVTPQCVNIPLAKDGDILITAANGSPRLVGKHCVIRNTHASPVVHGGFMLLASSDEPNFLNASMGSDWFRDFQAIGISGGNGAIGNLDKTELEEFSFYIPKEKAERDRIASFFRSLDTKISLQTQRIEKLKQMKAACLSKMIA